MEIDWDNGNESTIDWNTDWNTNLSYSAEYQGLTFRQHRINYVHCKAAEKYKHEKYQKTFVFKHPWTITALQTDPEGTFYKGDTGTGMLQWDSNVHSRFRDDVFFNSHLKSAWCL